MRTEFSILRQLLQYELHGAERHRRFMAMVMVTTSEDLAGLRNYLGSYVRNSDVVAHFDHSVAILMGETDLADAMVAVERYKAFFDTGVDLRFSVVTYPADGGKSDNLVRKAYQRLKKAKDGNPGEVVASD